ncbi:MAG: hypothetical protein WCW13_05800 [archaeon]|jgi:hypothetical protein
MVGPARQQRKPKVAKQCGTEYKMHFEERNQEELKVVSKILAGHGTRKKPLLLTGKAIKENEKEDTKKTNERTGYTLPTDEA